MTTCKIPPHDGPSLLYDTPFSEFPIQENESKTAHTARFKTQLLLDLVGNIRIIEYDKLKLSSDEIHALEQIEVPIDYLPPIDPTPLQTLSVHKLREMAQLVCATADSGQRHSTRSTLRPYSAILTPITTDQLDAAIQRGIRHKDWALDIRQHDIDVKKFEDAGLDQDDALLAYEMYTNEPQAFSHGVHVSNGYQSEASFQLVLEKVKLSRFRPKLRQELTACYFADRDRFNEYKKAGIWWEGKYDIDLFYGDLSTRDPDGQWNIQKVITRFHDTYHRYKYYQSNGVKIIMLPYVDTFWKPGVDPKTALGSYYYEIGKYESERQEQKRQALLAIKPLAPEPMTREESYQLAKDCGYNVKWDSSTNDYTYVGDEPIQTIFAPENTVDYKPDPYNYRYAERQPDLTLGISDYYREKEARIHREIGQNGGYMVYY